MANEVTIRVKAKDSASKVLDTVGRTIVRQFTEASTAVLKWSGIVATALPAAVTLLAPVVAWTAKLTTAALAAAPALAVFAVQGVFLKATLGQIFAEGSAVVKALSPLGTEFTKAGAAASKAAAEGIRPMVDGLIKMGLMDRVAGVMKNIGIEVNKVLFGLLTWAKTKPGIEALSNIFKSIETSVAAVSPAITRLVMSFLEMVGRIAEVSTAAGAEGLTGVLDKLSEAMDGVTSKDVEDALEDLKIKLQEIKTFIMQVVTVVAQIVAFFQKWKTEINLVIDALSLLVIALFPILGPLAAVVAAVSLIVRHWDQLKAAFAGTSELLGPIIAAFQYFWQVVGPSVMAAFAQIKAAVMPVLQQIARQIKSDVIPAIGEFIVAIAPLVSVLVSRLGPVVAAVFRGIATVISINIQLGVAMLRMMSAAIRTLMAAYSALVALVRSAMAAMRSAVSSASNAVVTLLSSLGSRIRGVFASAGTWLIAAGRNLINGLITGIREAASGAATAAANVVKAAAAAARAAIPGFAQGGNVGATAASGGPRGGQVLVGERGPEVVTLPYGSHVSPNGNTGKGGGMGGDIYLTIDLGKGIIERLKVHDREIQRAVTAGRSGY